MSGSTLALPLARHESLDTWAFYTLVAFVGALQVSIAAANILLTVVYLAWLALVVKGREKIELPPFFPPLILYAVLTLVSVGFSLSPNTSFLDSKQLVLFLLVPVVYRLARGGPARSDRIVSVIVTVGAASALFGILQYGILEYDNLGRRPQGALGHYMTYSGLLLLVASTAMAKVLFGRSERTWPLLVLPAVFVALALTLTRGAWVGASVAVGLLLALKDFRLVAVVPVVAALFFTFAPGSVADRLQSIFDLHDPTTRDRVAMLRTGARIIRDRPLTGVGPDVVKLAYLSYRDPLAVKPLNPHLHNVPVQIAAERGLPALGAWIFFVVILTRELWKLLRRSESPLLPAAGLAAVAGMLTAGMFEYNFGDSEFLMLFLVLVTLPFAAARTNDAAAASR